MHRLFKSQHIRKSSDFEKFRSKCTGSVRGGDFVLKLLSRGGKEGLARASLPRIGVITPKKIGKAVARNRVRRAVYEIFRLNPGVFELNRDYLFVASPGIGAKSRGEVEKILLLAAERLKKYLPPVES
jgi:ribonuclease P protein component